MGEVRFDLPGIDVTTRPFWDGAAAGRLVIGHCDDCDDAIFYPRPFCPNCWGENVSWREASGRATLYTWSIVYRNDVPPFASRVPYVAAIVELKEGPKMMTNVIDCEFDALAVGMALEVTFAPLGESLKMPVFRPAKSLEASNE